MLLLSGLCYVGCRMWYSMYRTVSAHTLMLVAGGATKLLAFDAAQPRPETVRSSLAWHFHLTTFNLSLPPPLTLSISSA